MCVAFLEMSDCKPVSSKLDQNAKEFVPLADIKQRTLSEMKTVVEDVFNVPLGEVQAHMKKVSHPTILLIVFGFLT